MLMHYPRGALSNTEYKATSQNDRGCILFTDTKRTISMSKQFRLAVY